MGGVSESHYERHAKFSDMIPDNDRGNSDIFASTTARREMLMDKIFQHESKEETKCHPNEYRETTEYGEVEDIDNELDLMDIDACSDSEEGSEEPNFDSVIKTNTVIDNKLNETSKPTGTIVSQSANSQAKEIVDQIKAILVQKFQQSLGKERYIHVGITCSECNVCPIMGTRYKCSICIEYNLCEICEISTNHDHVFIKVKQINQRVPMLCEMKHMIKNMPHKPQKMEISPHIELPSLALDISYAFGFEKTPIKSHSDIKRATLIQLSDNDFLKLMVTKEIEGEDKINNDLMIKNSWTLKNESEEAWPLKPENLVLKCLSNECLIKLKDLTISENEMKPLPIEPNKTSVLSIEFILPHRIRLAAMKTKKTLNIIFSLYDVEESKYVGSNLPCTILL